MSKNHSLTRCDTLRTGTGKFSVPSSLHRPSSLNVGDVAALWSASLSSCCCRCDIDRSRLLQKFSPSCCRHTSTEQLHRTAVRYAPPDCLMRPSAWWRGGAAQHIEVHRRWQRPREISERDDCKAMQRTSMHAQGPGTACGRGEATTAAGLVASAVPQAGLKKKINSVEQIDCRTCIQRDGAVQ